MGHFIPNLKTIDSEVIMKTVLALILLIAVASAASTNNKCEQENEILKKAIIKMVKAKQPKLDCSTCIGDITAAATDCILSLDTLSIVFWISLMELILVLIVSVKLSRILVTYLDKTGLAKIIQVPWVAYITSENEPTLMTTQIL